MEIEAKKKRLEELKANEDQEAAKKAEEELKEAQNRQA